MPKIMITGAAGFIGANFVHYWLENHPDDTVVVLDSLTYASNLANLDRATGNPRYHFVKGTINDQELVEKLLVAHDLNIIINFAAESHVDRSILSPDEFIHTNIVGTHSLLKAARNIWLDSPRSKSDHRFHQVSTDEIYGTLGPEEPPFSETNLYAPNSPYSASKASADHLVRSYHHTYGLQVSTSSCSNNYGPYQHSEKFIPTIIRCCLNHEAIPVYGDGSNIRDWLYVMDHCTGIDAILSKGRVGEVYNIGGLNEWANIDICRLICQHMDDKYPQNAPHQDLMTFVKDRPGHDWRYAINAAKMHDELGWNPAESFESGIIKTVAWYTKG